MPNYNLIHSGLISTNASGTKSLSTDELTFLYNGNTTTSGIVLLNTDVLYIDIDLYNRVNTEDFKLYIDVVDRVASLVNVDFYYKNLVGDEYILCSKAQDEEAFYPVSLPGLFAPRFCRVVIDSLDCTIFEIELTNDDDQVAFGEDGNQSLVTVDHTYGNYTTLPIFNNAAVNTSVVNAYVLVDYQENESDFYLTLSDDPEGEYKSLADGAFIHTDDTSFNYTWSRGIFEGTLVDGDNIQTDPDYYESSYYYTTPVVLLGDPFMSSFLITKQTATTSGTSITWANPEDKPIVKLRSSNIAPLAFTKFFITSTDASNTVSIYEADLASGAMNGSDAVNTTSASNNTVLFDKTSGTFLILLLNTTVVRYKYNALGDEGIINSSSATAYNGFKDNWGVDGYGNVWGYVSSSGYKLRFLNAATLVATSVLEDGAVTFVTDLSPSLRYASCWFTDPGVNMLKHIDANGEMLVSKSMNSPTFVASLYDGGCLVVDAGTATITRVDYAGTTISTTSYSSTYEIIDMTYGIQEEAVTPEHERFWILTSNGYVFQIAFDGTVMSETRYISATKIYAFLGGCLVHCPSLNKTYQLNSDGTQSRVWNYDALDTIGVSPCPIVMSYKEYLKQAESDTILPLYSDPVWGDGIDEGWKEVKDDGYLLPFANYHQLKYKFTPTVIGPLLVNGGFETGDLSGWTLTDSGPYVYDTTHHDGDYSFSTEPTTLHANMYQNVSLSAFDTIDFDLLDNNPQGYTFNLNYWIKRSYIYSSGYYGEITVNFYDSDWVEINNTSLYAKYSNEIQDAIWYNYNQQCKIPSATRNIRLTVKLYYHYTYGRQYFDSFDIQLMHSPELNMVGVPEPVKLVDIMPQTSKNIYLKTDFPVGTVDKDYETRLKCWWGAQEE